MRKTITITDGMYTPLIMALRAAKKLNEEHRQFALARGRKDMAQTYEKDIQAIDQMLEIVRGAKWKE